VKQVKPCQGTIQVYLDNKTGSCVIEDQGRGIPITPADNHPDIPTLNAVFERDNMGSKGNKSGIEQVGYNIKQWVLTVREPSLLLLVVSI